MISELFDFLEEVNPWLVRSSTTTTTNLNALPGTRSSDPIFTLPSQFESKDVSIWLAKSKKPITKVEKENYDDWLWVPQAKMDQKSKSLLDPWLEKSSTMSWTSTSSTTDNSSCKVEEWLKNALDDVTEDFDDCSIEIIADQWNFQKILSKNFCHDYGQKIGDWISNFSFSWMKQELEFFSWFFSKVAKNWDRKPKKSQKLYRKKSTWN